MNERTNLPVPGNSGVCNQSWHPEIYYYYYHFLIDGVFLLLTLQEGPVIPDANMLNLGVPGI